MTTIFDFCNNTVYLKERKDNSSILFYGFDDKYLEFEISDFGTIKENSINTNMNKAQTYFNTNSIKDLFITYITEKKL
jgi:hypothetical protein